MTLATVAFRHFQLMLWERDNGCCGICKAPVDVAAMQIDHIIPVSMGGSDDLDNLQPSHPQCNRIKGGKKRSPGTRRKSMNQHESPPSTPEQFHRAESPGAASAGLARALAEAERLRRVDDLAGAARWEQIAAGIAQGTARDVEVS